MRRRWIGCCGLVLLLIPSARGDGPAKGFVIQPAIETQAATVSVGNGAVYAGSVVGPTLRLGYQHPRFRLTGDLRYGALVAVNGGDLQGQHALTVGATVSPLVWSFLRHCTRVSVLGGFNVGALIDNGPMNNRDAFLTGGFLLGAALDHFWKQRMGVGVELGVQTQFTRFPGELATTVGIHLAVSGLFLPQVAGAGGGGANPPADGCQDGPPPPPVVQAPPPETTTPRGPVLCDDQHPCNGVPPCNGPDDKRACTPQPPPTTYGEEIDPTCSVKLTDGWFAPTQGVFTDDAKFDEKVAAIYRATGDAVVYFGTLGMVKDRHSVLTGVNWYIKNKLRRTIRSRQTIAMEGTSTCRANVSVKMQFVLYEGGVPRVIHTSPVLAQLPLRGGPSRSGEEVPWRVSLPAIFGVPAPPDTFKFEKTGPYWIEARLITEDGRPTAMRMLYFGNTHEVRGPSLDFHPIVLQAETTVGQPLTQLLVALTQLLMAQSYARLPDWYPIPPRSVQVRLGALLDFSPPAVRTFWSTLSEIDDAFTFNDNMMAARVASRLQTTSAWTGGRRIIGVLSVADFSMLFSKEVAGIAVSDKVSLLDTAHDAAVVAHEVAHNTPQHLWSSDEMTTECGRDYHNAELFDACGLSITNNSAPQRHRQMWDGPCTNMIMGPAVTARVKWMEQCTYKHLLHNLNGMKDPPMFVLSAVLARKGEGLVARFGPAYDVMTEEELRDAEGGDFAFVLKDKSGKRLGRFPFAFSWSVGDGPDWTIKPISHRVPALPNVATIELWHQGKVLDTITRTAAAPVLALRGVKAGAVVKPQSGRVKLQWTARVAPKHTAWASVLYSSDGGKSWDVQLYEADTDQHELVLNPSAREHHVRLILSDGTRSSETVVRFTSR